MTTAPAATSTWTIDPVHSVAEFSVKHMMVATVKGRFQSLDGTFHIDEVHRAASSVTASVDTASVDTGNDQRDAHLRSDDFFNAEQFPKMTFRSARVVQAGDDEWKVAGDLTIRDITRPVVFDVEFEGQIKDAFGKQRAALTAQTTINRKDFGLNWNGLIESGGVIVGDKVKITLHVAAVRQD